MYEYEHEHGHGVRGTGTSNKHKLELLLFSAFALKIKVVSCVQSDKMTNPAFSLRVETHRDAPRSTGTSSQERSRKEQSTETSTSRQPERPCGKCHESTPAGVPECVRRKTGCGV